MRDREEDVVVSSEGPSKHAGGISYETPAVGTPANNRPMADAYEFCQGTEAEDEGQRYEQDTEAVE